MALSNKDLTLEPRASAEAIRQNVIEFLTTEIGSSVFEMWFGDLNNILIDDRRLIIQADSPFALNQISLKYGATFQKAARHICGPRFQVHYRLTPRQSDAAESGSPLANESDAVSNDGSSTKAVVEQSAEKFADACPLSVERGVASGQGGLEKHHSAHDREPMHAGDLASPGNGRTDSPRATGQAVGRRGEGVASNARLQCKARGLDSFIFGANNRLAQAGVTQMFQRFGQLSPLLIYGPTGCGKTHLLEAIVSDARRKFGMRRTVYMTAEQFTTFFVGALRGSGLPSFRRKYRALDLLAIDDVQFFSGKKATLSEFQYTIDNLLREGKQIVLASDRPPVELGQFSNEMLARFSSGLVCTLEYPDVEARFQITRRFSQFRGMDFDDEVCREIAGRLPRDVRRISGAVNRIYATSVANDTPVTLELASAVLDELYPPNTSKTSLDQVERAVCEFCDISPRELRGKSRRKRISAARMLAMYLSRQYTSSAFSEIGDHFGGRAHSTVISAEKKVHEWIQNNQAIELPQSVYPIREALMRLESQLRVG